MTKAELFVSWAESAYGKYASAMKDEVVRWLSVKDDYFITAMREVVLRDHPSTFGKPPGVHELDAFKIEAYSRGHTLEAITKAGIYRVITAEPVMEDITEEQAEANARRFREKMGMNPDHRPREGVVG